MFVWILRLYCQDGMMIDSGVYFSLAGAKRWVPKEFVLEDVHARKDWTWRSKTSLDYYRAKRVRVTA